VVHSREDNRGNMTSEDSGGSPQDWQRYIPTILTLLSSIAGLGTVIYILGICSLWVPIQRTYSGDFVAAWHATSLVPKTVVMGLGAQHLVAVPLVFVAIMVLIAVTVEYVCLTPLRALQSIGLVRLLRPIRLPARVQREKQEKRLERLERLEPRIFLWALITIDSFLAWGLIGFYLGWRMNAYLPDNLKVPTWGIAGATLLTSVGLYAVVSALIITRWSDSSGDTHKTTDDITLRRYSKRYVWVTLIGAPMYLLFTFLVIFWTWYSDTSNKPWHPKPLHFNLWPPTIAKPQDVQVGPLLHHLFKAFDADALVGIVIIAFAGVSLLAVNTVILGEFVREGGYRRTLLGHRLAMGVVWAFIAAFAFTIINQPPLPEVDVQGTPSVEGGRLLAHTDGFWYVYNTAGDLIAIRDDNVKTVTYKSEP
jgi:hypothetical protein